MATGDFTSADLTTIKSAILTLTSGVEMVMINGRMWRKSQLSQLWNLYREVKKEVRATETAGIRRGSFKFISNQDDN